MPGPLIPLLIQGGKQAVTKLGAAVFQPTGTALAGEITGGVSVGVSQGVSEATSGDPPREESWTGWGVRNTLGIAGGALGGASAGLLGLPSGPGAFATAAIGGGGGYLAGDAIGWKVSNWIDGVDASAEVASVTHAAPAATPADTPHTASPAQAPAINPAVAADATPPSPEGRESWARATEAAVQAAKNIAGGLPVISANSAQSQQTTPPRTITAPETLAR